MHQDGKLQGTSAIVDISEEATDRESGHPLPNIAVDSGEEYGGNDNGESRAHSAGSDFIRFGTLMLIVEKSS